MFKPAIILFLASILWGSAWMPLTMINQQGLDGIALLLCAYVPASILSLLWIWYQRLPVLQNKKALLHIAIAGGVANTAFSLGLINGDVIRVMVLFYCLPIWSTLLGYFILKERITHYRVLTLALVMLGVCLVLGVSQSSLVGSMTWFDALGLLAGFAYAVNNIAFRQYKESPLSVNVAAMLTGSALSLLCLLPWLDINALPSVATPFLGAALYGITWLLLVSYGSQYGVSFLPAATSAMIILTELVTSVFTSYLWGDAEFSYSIGAGCVLVLSAILLESRELTVNSKPLVE